MKQGTEFGFFLALAAGAYLYYDYLLHERIDALRRNLLDVSLHEPSQFEQGALFGSMFFLGWAGMILVSALIRILNRN